MCLGGSAVDALNIGRIVHDKAIGHLLPDASLRPTVEPVIDGCRWTISRRTVAPSTTNLQDMDSPTDNLAISPRLHARAVRRYLRFDGRPTLIVKREQVRHRGSPLLQGALNRTPHDRGKR